MLTKTRRLLIILISLRMFICGVAWYLTHYLLFHPRNALSWWYLITCSWTIFVSQNTRPAIWNFWRSLKVDIWIVSSLIDRLLANVTLWWSFLKMVCSNLHNRRCACKCFKANWICVGLNWTRWLRPWFLVSDWQRWKQLNTQHNMKSQWYILCALVTMKRSIKNAT